MTDDDAPGRSQANMMQKACLVLALAAASASEEGTTNDRGGGSKKKKSSNKKEETLYATLFGIAAGILALLACGVCYMASKERKGEPLFAPKPASNPMRDDLEKA